VNIRREIGDFWFWSRPPLTMKEARSENLRGLPLSWQVTVIIGRILIFIVVGETVVGLTQWLTYKAWPGFGFWTERPYHLPLAILGGGFFFYFLCLLPSAALHCIRLAVATLD
jgi:peptidoglycan biosynthesis protein MviN/MurJ (putative lipid II flippase)